MSGRDQETLTAKLHSTQRLWRASRRAGAKLAAPFGASLLALSLGGCAVGPDFISPPAPAVDRYTPERLSTAGAEKLVVAGDIPERWWEVFHNKNLNRLVEASIAHNPSMDAARAAIRIAYYGAEAQKGAFLPTLLAESSDTYQFESFQQQTLGAGPTNPFAIFQKQLSISYTPDVWGANRRAVESLEAQTEQQRYQLEATYLTLTTNVASAAIGEASLRGQAAATREVISEVRKMLDILRKQYAIGAVAQADVLTQEATLAQMEQLLPPLEKALAQQRDLLTALAGQYSTAEVPETFNLKGIALPRDVPVTLPCTFVRQRPDVRQAEANMHALSAQIGVAIAARLPNVTLSANAGSSAFSLTQLFTPLPPPGSMFWVGASNISAPIFDGFTLMNKQKAAEVALTQAEAQYRQAVITAFQNVADAMRAMQADDKAVKAAVHAETVAKKSYEIVKKQFLMGEGGTVNMLQLITAETTWLQAAVTRMAAEGQRLTDVVGLFMALGGGWQDQNLKNLPPNGPNGPTPAQVASVRGPVNASWFPSFLDRESADDREPLPKAPPPVVPLVPLVPAAPVVPVAPAPTPVAAPIVGPPPAAPSGWLPGFLD